MPNHTHADLLSAIDKARRAVPDDRRTCKRGPDCDLCRGNESTRAHLDTLRAILDLHAEQPPREMFGPPVCSCSGTLGYGRPWPCATVQVVIDALTRMGAL